MSEHVWMDAETGEVFEGGDCPRCAHVEDEAGIQVASMERELRGYRSKLTKLERRVEQAEVTRRDKETWQRILDTWSTAFPERRMTAKGIKSTSATHTFLRLESGGNEGDIEDAIRAAKAFPYVVYGKRVRTGSPSDLAVHLQDILAVKNDKAFDWLVEAGRALRDAES